jgi:hypothetical protein
MASLVSSDANLTGVHLKQKRGNATEVAVADRSRLCLASRNRLNRSLQNLAIQSLDDPNHLNRPIQSCRPTQNRLTRSLRNLVIQSPVIRSRLTLAILSLGIQSHPTPAILSLVIRNRLSLVIRNRLSLAIQSLAGPSHPIQNRPTRSRPTPNPHPIRSRPLGSM